VFLRVSLPGFAAARVVLGIGVSAGLMSIIKANSQWFAPAQVAGITGIAMALSALGSVITTAPVEWALPMLGWRGVFWIMAAATLATALWIAFAFFGASGASGYVAVSQMFPPEQVGRVSTAVNAMVLGGAFLMQSLIGWILDFWPRTAAGGWDPRGYSAALMLSVAVHLLVTAQLLGWTTRAPRKAKLA